MQTLNLAWFKTLSSKEKQLMSMGIGTFLIGIFILWDFVIPLSWVGRAETKGEIVQMLSMKKGSFSGGSGLYLMRYYTPDGQQMDGTFTASPAVLSIMKTIRVFYKTQNPTNFYVFDPSKRIIGIVALVFGVGILGTYISYLFEKKK
jgi:uncharacterized protein YjeT (DUF2065 family)